MGAGKGIFTEINGGATIDDLRNEFELFYRLLRIVGAEGTARGSQSFSPRAADILILPDRL